MKIAFLTPRFPFPPDRGDRLTVYHLLRVLSERHAVTLFSFVDGSEPPEAFERVRPLCRAVVTVRLPRWRSWLQAWMRVASPIPSQVAYYASARMRAALRERLSREPYDAIFCHTIRLASYVADLPHPAKILWIGDSLGMALGRGSRFAPRWRRPGMRWERHRLDRFTARASRDYADVWAISEDDRNDLLRIGCPYVTLVTHGVDERLFELSRPPLPPPRAVFLGNLSVPHNVDAARHAAIDVWPGVRREIPTAELWLAGVAAVAAVRSLADRPGVRVVGAVPDLRSLWSSVALLLAPLRFSTGIQNKILEAMAAGVPVVTTPTAAAALGAGHGVHVLTAETPSALAAAVVDVLQNPAPAAARAERARALVRRQFRWESAVERLEAVVERAAGAAEPAPGRLA